MNSNKLRLFYILEIMTRYTDENHFLSSGDIADKLKEDYDFKDIDRKTIYSDISSISKAISNVQNISGYGYRMDHLFSLSEIKIIEDSINGLKDIGTDDKVSIINRVRNLTSEYNEKLLKKIETPHPSISRKIVNHIGIILSSIESEESVIIKFKGKSEEVIPYLLDFDNSHYYIYYSYDADGRIYHMRLDRITAAAKTERKHGSKMRIDECRKIIRESVESFSSKDIEEVRIEIIDNESFVIEHMQDSFDNIIINKNGNHPLVNIKVSISSVFFSKLSLYGSSIRIISPDSVKEEYISFLKDIISTV